MNNQGSEAAQKENEKSPENKLKDLEICELNDREFDIASLKKQTNKKTLNSLQGNTDR